MARIAVIDDAICDSLLQQPVAERYCFESGAFQKAWACIGDDDTHGTLVAKVLETYANQYEIVSIQVLENWFEQRTCSVKRLAAALELCIQIDVDLIHISIGSERLSDIRSIGKILNRIIKANIPVVAACSNVPCRTVPAACNNVFGVVCDQNDVLQAGSYVVEMNPYLGTEFVGNYVLSIPQAERFPKSNSLTAPVITARVNDFLNQQTNRPCIPEIFAYLEHHARQDCMVQRAMNNRKVKSVPIIHLVDIFAKDIRKQTALLDAFAADGYEAVGISYTADGSDVRLLNCTDAMEDAPHTVQTRLLAHTKSDVLLVFLCEEMAKHGWQWCGEPGTVVVYGEGQSLTDMGTLCGAHCKLEHIENPKEVYAQLIQLFD